MEEPKKKEGVPNSTWLSRYTPESLRDLLPAPHTINAVIACAFFSTGLYLLITLVIGGWIFQEGEYPVLVKQSTLFQFGEKSPNGLPVRTFLVSSSVPSSPFPEVYEFMPTDKLFKDTPAQALTEIIPKNSHDYCIHTDKGYAQVSLTHTIVSPVNYSSRFIGISLGAARDSIFLLIDLGSPSGYASIFLLVVSLAQSLFLLYVKKYEGSLTEDSKRRNLIWILEVKRLGMIVPAVMIIMICIGVKDMHAVTIISLWSIVNQLMRVMFSTVIECVMTFTRNQRTETYMNSLSVIFLTKLFVTLYLVSEALKVIVIIFRANNWFIAVPDMSVFESQYDEGVQVEAKTFSLTYVIGIWLLDVWSSSQYVSMISVHLSNKLSGTYGRGALDYRLFSWNEFVESLLNGFLFFVFFVFLASPRFINCANK